MSTSQMELVHLPAHPILSALVHLSVPVWACLGEVNVKFAL